jgi:hypothetical protein
MSLQDIVNVTISKTGKQVTQIGFGTPLILGSSTSISPDLIRSYQSVSAVVVDFATSTPEYKAAVACFSQSPHPTTIKIGRRGTEVVQVTTITPNVTVQSVQQYIETVNGVAYTFTSDATPTAAEVTAGLVALINAGQGSVLTASGTNTLTLTSNVAGVAFTHSESANLTAVYTTPNHGAADDLTQIQNIDDDWYGVMLTSRADHDILGVASWIETQLKMFCACSADVNALTLSSTTDAFALVQGKKYARTFCLWSDDQQDFPDAAWLGAVLPLTPGSETWAFKSLVGITASKLNATQLQALKNRNANYYITIAGNDITLDGKVSDNEYIDSVRFIDSFQAGLEEAIFATLINAPKIPYTDNGATVIEADVRAQIKQGIGAGGIATDPEPTVFVPKAVDQTQANRAGRMFPGINFTWRLAGAIQEINVSGNVSV